MLLTVTLFTPTTQLRRDTMFNLSGIETVYAPPWTGRGLGAGVIRLICYSIYNFEETIQIILLKECTKK